MTFLVLSKVIVREVIVKEKVDPVFDSRWEDSGQRRSETTRSLTFFTQSVNVVARVIFRIMAQSSESLLLTQENKTDR